MCMGTHAAPLTFFGGPVAPLQTVVVGEGGRGVNSRRRVTKSVSRACSIGPCARFPGRCAPRARRCARISGAAMSEGAGAWKFSGGAGRGRRRCVSERVGACRFASGARQFPGGAQEFAAVRAEIEGRGDAEEGGVWKPGAGFESSRAVGKILVRRRAEWAYNARSEQAGTATVRTRRRKLTAPNPTFSGTSCKE